MNDSALTFASPHYLILGTAVCALIWWILRSFRARNRASLEGFAGNMLLPRLLNGYSGRRRALKRFLVLAAIFTVFAALARPQKGVEWEEATRKGIDVAIALDTSKSMLAPDVVPNRLERAKLAVADFVTKLEGDRVGLIPFAGTAFVLCPPTLDYEAFLQSLQMLDTDIMPRPGTNLAAAIRTSMEAIGHSANDKIIILISDGEELEGSALEAAQEAAKEGARIFTVGVGSAAGDLIVVPGRSGNSTFLKDATGNPVKSRLDEEMLTRIAGATRGSYFPLGRKGDALDRIYTEELKGIEKHDIQQRMKRIPVERFEWCLFAAFLLLMIEYGLSDRTSSEASGPASKLVNLMALAFAITLSVSSAHASPKAATKAYENGEYDQAVKELEADAKESDDPVLNFNLGAAYYKHNQYEPAIEQFGKALTTTDLDMQSKAYFNMGNSYFRKGETLDATQENEKKAAWQQALEEYERALKLNSKDENALHNKEFVKKKLEELMQKQQQQQDKSSGKQNSQKQKDQNDKQQQEENKQQETPREQQNQQDQQQQQSGEQENDPANPNDERGKQDEEKHGQEETASKQAEQSAEPTVTPEKPPSAKEKSKHEDERKKNASSAAAKRGGTEMTPEEAVQLLDSLRNEEKQVMPMNPATHAGEDEVERNW